MCQICAIGRRYQRPSPDPSLLLNTQQFSLRLNHPPSTPSPTDSSSPTPKQP